MSPEAASPKVENVREMTIERIVYIALHTESFENVDRLFKELDRRRLETIDRSYNPNDIRTTPEYKENLQIAIDVVAPIHNALNPNYLEPSQPLKIVL